MLEPRLVSSFIANLNDSMVHRFQQSVLMEAHQMVTIMCLWYLATCFA